MAGDDVEPWIATARRSLAVAHLANGAGFHDAAAFHAHQAAESSLKAVWIVRVRALPPHPHRLYELAERLTAPADVLAATRRLNPHYAASRYPDAANGDPAANYDDTLASELIALAEKVSAWCLSQLPS